jgi:hypothetical protein
LPTLHLKDFKWYHFDHTLTLSLGFSGGTQVCYEKNTNEPVVLRSCGLKEYTAVRLGLTKTEATFITTRCTFSHNDKMYICLDLFDLSLSNIICSDMGLSEIHIKPILRAACYFNAYL